MRIQHGTRWFNTLLAWMRGRTPGPHHHSRLEHAVPAHAPTEPAEEDSTAEEQLAQAESSLGQSDWRDPETGELAQDTRLHRAPDTD